MLKRKEDILDASIDRYIQRGIRSSIIVFAIKREYGTTMKKSYIDGLIDSHRREIM